MHVNICRCLTELLAAGDYDVVFDRAVAEDGLNYAAPRQALTFLTQMFAAGVNTPGAAMAGRVEEGVGEF